MMYAGHHPAPGIGDLLPGWFSVPQNPIMAGAVGSVKYTPTIGDLIAAKFSVPQNPLVNSHTGIALAGVSGVGCGGGCSCSGRCDAGMNGILDDAMGAISSVTSVTVMGIPVLYLAGGALLLWMITHPKSARAEKAAERASARATYKRSLARIEGEHSVRRAVGRRVRAVAA